MARKAKHSFLGGLDASTFLRRHWQRKPLLVRGAFPAFDDPLDAREVLRLAQYEEATSRLVTSRAGRWTLAHGPFAASTFKQLPSRNWTVLVSDTNHFSTDCARLLERFDFIPHARVDDLQVSYAVPGGGVGPHVDSYDVFLLQGRGRRRWQVAKPGSTAFVPGLPLKILARFEPDDEWVLEAGDMLYLPPGVPHCGVALDECLTWSVGFRAPSDRELVAAFLDHLRDTLSPAGHYRDPGARPARNAGAIPEALIAHTAHALRAIRWTDADVRDFAGRLLSEPKDTAVFLPPARPTTPSRFAHEGARRGLVLDGRSRLLFSGSMAWMNGEPVRIPRGAAATLRSLANARRLDGPVRANAAFWALAHAWHAAGYLDIAAPAKPQRRRNT